VIPEEHLRGDDSDRSPYRYDHPSTAGWGGDRIVAYTNGSTSAYVFESTWDTEADAREFQAAYVDLLFARGAREVSDDIYRIPENSSYGDAFRVVRNGSTVVVVNAPTVDDLDDVHTTTGESDPPKEDTDAPIARPGAGGVGTLFALAAAAALFRGVRRRRE
jgi:hypothetical protein